VLIVSDLVGYWVGFVGSEDWEGGKVRSKVNPIFRRMRECL